MPDTVLKDAAVMIIDGVDSATIANVLGPKVYDEQYLQRLHMCYRSVLTSASLLRQVREDEVKEIPKFLEFTAKYALDQSCFAHWTGDEFSVVFCCGEPVKDILAALWIAVETLMRWYQREPNLARLREGSEPYHLSCGIHYGPVSIARRRSTDDCFHWKPEGIAFAYAKRAQSEARDGTYTRMFITEEIGLNRKAVEEAIQNIKVFAKWETEDRGMRTLKGLGQKRLLEVKWFIPPAFLIMPGAFDAIYAFLMKYPIQPGLAFWLHRYLKQIGEDAKASKLKDRFSEIGHIFPNDEHDNGTGTTNKEPSTE